MTDENNYKDFVLGKSAKHGFTIIASKHSLRLSKGDKSSHFCSWDEIASFFEGYEYDSFNEGIKAIAIALDKDKDVLILTEEDVSLSPGDGLHDIWKKLSHDNKIKVRAAKKVIYRGDGIEKELKIE